MTKSFIRHVSHYPRIFLPQTEDAVDESFRFPRNLEVRPGRFIVNNPQTQEPDWQIPEVFLPADEAVVAPLHAALYLGRIEDISTDDGSCFVKVWEVPNGRMGTTILTREQVADLDVAVGDTVRIYAWIEVPLAANGEPLSERSVVRVVATPRTPLSEQERAQLEALIAQFGDGQP